jgi:hypothetical protein
MHGSAIRHPLSRYFQRLNQNFSQCTHKQPRLPLFSGPPRSIKYWIPAQELTCGFVPGIEHAALHNYVFYAACGILAAPSRGVLPCRRPNRTSGRRRIW